MISFSMLLVVIFAFTRVLISSGTASDTNHEATVAREAARQMMEVLRASDFSQAFANFNGDPTDDPGGPGTSPGSQFAVDGIDPLASDLDGLEGAIIFPVNGAAPGILREDLQLPRLGLPADLDGDGLVDAADHSLNYNLLPVIVQVQWRSPSGAATCEFRTLLSNLQ